MLWLELVDVERPDIALSGPDSSRYSQFTLTYQLPEASCPAGCGTVHVWRTPASWRKNQHSNQLCTAAAGLGGGAVRQVPQNPAASEPVCLCLCVAMSHCLQGLNILIPVVDQIKYVQSLKERVVDIPSQSAITEGQSVSCPE